MTRTIFIAAALALAATLPAVPAQATGAPRTFVSAVGSDSNNCTNVATPCRHLAAAFAATAANGEIYVLDPANYGSLTITHAVSIEGHGWASIAPVANSAAITINAGLSDKINIIGVVLDGTALTATTGIALNSGGSLNVRDSVIRNFAVHGISFVPTASSTIFVSNTLISDNGGNGIEISSTTVGTTTGVFDHVQIENNVGVGLLASSTFQTVNITFSDSVSANNDIGIYANPFNGTASIMVRNSTIANNSEYGLEATTGGTVRATRSTMTGNGAGWIVFNGGIVLSYGDNNIDGNGTANTEPPGPLTYK